MDERIDLALAGDVIDTTPGAGFFAPPSDPGTPVGYRRWIEHRARESVAMRQAIGIVLMGRSRSVFHRYRLIGPFAEALNDYLDRVDRYCNAQSH